MIFYVLTCIYKVIHVLILWLITFAMLQSSIINFVHVFRGPHKLPLSQFMFNLNINMKIIQTHKLCIYLKLYILKLI